MDQQEEEYKCTKCDKLFSRKDCLTRHMKLHKANPHIHSCDICDRTFNRKDILMVHKRKMHEEPSFKCTSCDKTFHTENLLQKHMKTHDRSCPDCGRQFKRADRLKHHVDTKQCTQPPTTSQKRKREEGGGKSTQKKSKPNASNISSASFNCAHCRKKFKTVGELKQHSEQAHTGEKKKSKRKSKQSALEGSMQVIEFLPEGDEKQDILQFFSNQKDDIDRNILHMVSEKGACKWFLSCLIKFSKQTGEGGDERVDTVAGFSSKTSISTEADMVEENSIEAIDNAYFKMYKDIGNFQREGSGWEIEEVLHLKLSMAAYNPVGGSSYTELPPVLAQRHCIVNIVNTDNKCFIWSILAYLHPVTSHRTRVNNYKEYENSLDMSGIQYPVELKDIPKFTRQNNISVSVFGWHHMDDQDEFISGLYPLHIPKEQLGTHINLLLYQDWNDNTHYCLIQDLDCLLSHLTKGKNRARSYFCSYCLIGFGREDLLENHLPYCKNHGMQKVALPEKGKNVMKFKDYDKMLMVPFVIYADFESLIVKYGENGKTHEHKACGYAYRVVSNVMGYSSFTKLYRGENAIQHFLQSITEQGDRLCDILKNTNKQMLMTDQDRMDFKAAKTCFICEEPFEEEEQPVRDHCHLTGKYRGAAHNECNLKWQYKKHINVFFHNLRGYDGHLLCQYIGLYSKRKISCIPRNLEQYTCFSLGNLRFLDSLSFMSASLDSLVTNLGAEGDDSLFVHTRSEFPSEEKFKLVTRKGIYPYEYMDGFERFAEKSLPPKEAFYSTLSMKHITDEDYAYAQEVWSKFDIQDLGGWHDLYLRTDVVLLADCMENFRKTCLKHYRLDPAHFVTTPGLSWSAAMKMSGIKLHLLTDIEMHLFIEEAIRGGVSMISTKYAKANNQMIPDEYNPDERKSYILYADANNLYGYAMSQPLPYKEFRWSEDDLETILSTPDDEPLGYILEVDLEVPEELHDKFNSYPLAPEHITVDEQDLSPESRALLENLNLKHASTRKLVPNLKNKEKYVLHYRNLKLYKQQGLIITKVHRVLEFAQKAWLKEYIDFNTNMRKQAKNTFEKNFFKLCNNAVYGKTIESIRKRTCVKLIHKPSTFKKIVSKPNVRRFKHFSNNLVAVDLNPVSILLDRPVYAGMAVLDLSKLLMYDFYYNVLYPRYGSDMVLCFTDTDSLCLHIKTEDIYKDMKEMEEHFDFSDYPKSHVLHNEDNKKKIGKFNL